MAKTNAVVELYYSGAWHDITAAEDVYTRDPISITRGGEGASRIPPSAMNLSLKNTNRKYSFRHPSSELYGLIGRNTPIRQAIDGYDVTADTFNRVSASGWGTCEYDGTAWAHTGSGGTVADSDSHIDDPLTAIQSVPAASAYRLAYLTSDLPVNTTVTARVRALDTAGGSDILGAAIEGGLMLRVQDINNYIHPRVSFNAAQTITASLHVVGGTGSIGSATPAANITYAGQWLVVKAQATGSTVRMKVWEDGDPEPAAWDLSVTNSEITTAGGIGIRSGVALGNTNTGRHIQYRNLTIDRALRFAGEVETWPLRWSVEGNDVWAPITANGILRRLNAPGTERPAHSALRRTTTAGNGVAPVAYWAMEDGQQSASFGNLVDGAPALAIRPDATFTRAAIDGPPGSAGLSSWLSADATPTGLTGDSGAVTVSPVGTFNTGTGFWSVQFPFRGDRPADLGSGTRALYWHPLLVWTQDGTRIAFVAYADIVAGVSDPSNTSLDVAFSGGGGVSAVGDIDPFDSEWHSVRVTFTQDGADVDQEVFIDGVSVGTYTKTGWTLSYPVRLTGLELVSGSLPGAGASDNTNSVMSLGHLAFHDTAAGSWEYDAMIGYAGETAADRIERLCGEEGIAVSILGAAAESELVGAQRVAPLLDLLHDAGDADGGILYEPRSFLGLAYRTHASLYSQTATVELDYAAGGEVAPPLEPVPDTDAVVNDVTVTRVGGGSARVVQETGTLNVQEPTADPQGVGRIPKNVELVLYQDAQCLQQAYWRRHIGTWDEERYPVINLDLTAMEADGKTSLIADALSLDVGGRLTITDLPAWLPPDDIEQLAQGFAEIIGSHTHTIAANATPARPYDVGILDSTTKGKLDCSASTLTSGIDTDDTSLSITVADSCLWSTTGEPYDVVIGGERMTVTVCTGTSSPQTFTVTRSVNGEVKSHSAGAEVHIFKPFRLSR